MIMLKCLDVPVGIKQCKLTQLATKNMITAISQWDLGIVNTNSEIRHHAHAHVSRIHKFYETPTCVRITNAFVVEELVVASRR